MAWSTACMLMVLIVVAGAVAVAYTYRYRRSDRPQPPAYTPPSGPVYKYRTETRTWAPPGAGEEGPNEPR